MLPPHEPGVDANRADLRDPGGEQPLSADKDTSQSAFNSELPCQAGTGPLSGVVVLECNDAISLAFCGKVLADFGATVIKVQSPVDRAHASTTDMLPPDEASDSEALRVLLDANKLSVSLDLRTPRGRHLFASLADRAAIVTAFSDVSDRSLAEVVANQQAQSPGLIAVVLSWMGQSGPWRDFACDEFLAQHLSGMAFSTAVRVDDLESEPPLATPGQLASMVAGITAATAASIALFGREEGAPGDFIDISIVEAVTSFLRQELVTYTYGAGLMSRKREAVSRFAGVFQQPASDGYLDFMIRTEEMWRGVLASIGNPAWGELEVFASHQSRSLYWDALEPMLHAELKNFTRAELFRDGQRRGVPVAPVNTVSDAVRDEHLTSRGFFERGRISGSDGTFPGPPFWLDDPAPARGSTPFPGRDNVAVYRWAGLRDNEIEELTRDRVI